MTNVQKQLILKELSERAVEKRHPRPADMSTIFQKIEVARGMTFTVAGKEVMRLRPKTPGRSSMYTLPDMMPVEYDHSYVVDRKIAELSVSRVENHFDLLLRLDDEHHYHPTLKLNFDETWASLGALRNGSLVLLNRKDIQVGRVTTGAPKPVNLKASVFLGCTASGDSLPALILTRRKTIDLDLEKIPRGQDIRWCQTKKGFQTMKTLLKYFKQVILPYVQETRKCLPEGVSDRALLLLDSHESRRCQYLIQSCMDNDIDLLIFPGGSTPVLQPIDNGPANEFKKAMRKTSDMSTSTTCDILYDAIRAAGSRGITKRAWKLTGNHPSRRLTRGDHVHYPTLPVTPPQKKRKTSRMRLVGMISTEEALAEVRRGAARSKKARPKKRKARKARKKRKKK